MIPHVVEFPILRRNAYRGYRDV